MTLGMPLFSAMSPRAADYARALRLLKRGDYREGWPAYEARIDLPGTAIQRPALPFAEWTGENLAGKRLLIWPEQGLGDKIMFARFIPLIAAGDVVVLCEPALERLFRTNLNVHVVPASGRTEFPDPDAWALYGSLPARPPGLGAGRRRALSDSGSQAAARQGRAGRRLRYRQSDPSQ